ncbi:MAG: hypothetical protein WBF89_24180 [Steroidobacteraceae bacterium]
MFTHYFRITHRGAGNRQRARLLEALLARAETAAAVTDWRADAFRVLAPSSLTMPGLGAAALCAERGRVDAGWVFIATPVHYIAEMANVRLHADGIVSLAPPQADVLAADFNGMWHDTGMRLVPGRSGELFLLSDRPLEARTHDPRDALDRHIDDYLPSGADAPQLRRLMSEIEMWLFEHAVNRARAGSGQPPVKGLWLWGGGPALASLPSVAGWTAGDDPFFNALGARTSAPGMRTSAPGARTSGGVDAAAGCSASGVVAIDAEPGTDAWRDPESRWLEPSFRALKSGRIQRLDLSAGDRCFSLTGRWNWRPWRRRSPWWEVLA